jgi:CRISPR-associated protein Cas2
MRTRVLLIYDIENDRVRGKIADACLDYGLDRVQYSAFVGELSRNHQQELMLRIASLLGERSGNIKLIPISARDWSDRQEIDQ